MANRILYGCPSIASGWRSGISELEKLTKNMEFIPLFISIIAVLLGLTFFSVSVILGLRKVFRIRSWTKTTGVVVDVETSLGMHQSYSSPRATLYKPTVRFQTVDRRVIDYKPQTSNSWSNYNVGEQIPVYYNPQQPQNAIAGTPFGMWFGLIVFGLVGGAFTVIGTIVLLVSVIRF